MLNTRELKSLKNQVAEHRNVQYCYLLAVAYLQTASAVRPRVLYCSHYYLIFIRYLLTFTRL